MRVRLLGCGDRAPDDGLMQRVKHAGIPTRLLVTLAREFISDTAQTTAQTTGLYQALGQEKQLLARAPLEQGAKEGFDSIKPLTPLNRVSPYGSFAIAAVELGCRGPFWTLEADALAPATALEQAFTDLRLGRCQRALVGQTYAEAWAALGLFVRDPRSPLRVAIARFHDEPARAEQALEAHLGERVSPTAAAEGREGWRQLFGLFATDAQGPRALFWREPDGRGIALATSTRPLLEET